MIEAAQDELLSFPVLSIDASKNILYCAWIKGNTVQLEKRENESWQKVNFPDLGLTSPIALSCFYDISDGKLGIAILEWVDQKQLYHLEYYLMNNL
jgi:hypothetical protein